MEDDAEHKIVADMTATHRPYPRESDGRLARGEDSRARLRVEALRLFAEKGYAQTSTREICAAAGVNIAAIHYHFHDKAGLYRDAYLAPIVRVMEDVTRVASGSASFEDVLRETYRVFLEPLKVADRATLQILKLHFREQVDPTGLVGDSVFDVSRAHVDALAHRVAAELGLSTPDDDARRLVCALIGIAADFLTSADWGRRIVPALYGSADAIDRMVERMTHYGLAMLAAERRLRASPGATDPRAVAAAVSGEAT